MHSKSMGRRYEIIIDQVLTGLADYSNNDSWVHFNYHKKYNSEDVITTIHWTHFGNIGADITENKGWNDFYYSRHYPYKNIPTDEKIYDVWYIWNGSYTDRI